MIRFKCNGEPYIDPLYEFTMGEEAGRGQLLAYCPPIPLNMIVKNPINTSVFEEATIIEE
jgi:hypothetical protein